MPRGKDETQPGSLHLATQALLRASPLSTFEVAKETGLTYSWIVSFASGRMANPSVNRVQLLFEFLSGEKI